MFPWLDQTFMGEVDCMTSPKNVCIGCYLGRNVIDMGLLGKGRRVSIKF